MDDVTKVVARAVHDSAQINRKYGSKRPKLPTAICNQVADDILQAIKDAGMVIVPRVINNAADQAMQAAYENWMASNNYVGLNQVIHTAMIEAHETQARRAILEQMTADDEAQND